MSSCVIGHLKETSVGHVSAAMPGSSLVQDCFSERAILKQPKQCSVGKHDLLMKNEVNGDGQVGTRVGLVISMRIRTCEFKWLLDEG